MSRNQCTFCGSAEISEETLTTTNPSSWRLGFKPKKPNKDPWISINRSRVCWECGHVMVFLKETNLRRLRKQWDGPKEPYG